MRLLLVTGLGLSLLASTEVRSEAPRSSSPSKSTAKKSDKTTRRQHTKRRGRAVRCRSIFCTATRVSLDDRDAGVKKLTQKQVEKVMSTGYKQLEPCLVEARRRDPRMLKAEVEFVVSHLGRVLASRVNGKRRTTIARCIDKKIRTLRFPPSSPRRTVASFIMAFPQ